MSIKTNTATKAYVDSAIIAAKSTPQISSPATFSTTSTTMVDVTNLTVTITTTGRPVFIGLINDGTNTGASFIGASAAASNIENVTISINKNGSELIRQVYDIQAGSSTITLINYPVSTFSHIDTPSIGTYTYKIQMLSSNANTAQIVRARLIAYEL